MSEKFDWNSEKIKESVVMKSVQAIAVYTNPDGDVVIRQQDSMGDEDHFVVLPKSSAKALVKAITAESKT